MKLDIIKSSTTTSATLSTDNMKPNSARSMVSISKWSWSFQPLTRTLLTISLCHIRKASISSIRAMNNNKKMAEFQDRPSGNLVAKARLKIETTTISRQPSRAPVPTWTRSLKALKRVLAAVKTRADPRIYSTKTHMREWTRCFFPNQTMHNS